MNRVEDEINISLNRDEALVLFEFLFRFSGNDSLAILDKAEELYCGICVAYLKRF
jgi:hypothetical protein